MDALAAHNPPERFGKLGAADCMVDEPRHGLVLAHPCGYVGRTVVRKRWREVGRVVVAAIVVCEVGFWLVLIAGLLARYALRRPWLGGVLLVCVPLVDLALLVFTVIDLRRGAPPQFAHGLAAVYLGFSVVFGHAAVRWADGHVAHRWAGGPAPARKPAGGTPARLRLEWREFGQGCVAVALSALLLLGATWLVGDAGDAGDAGELYAWLGRLGFLLLVWLMGWPVWETVRNAASRST